uniref:G-protein coupled receptors family 1 profile domain-containing protein n=1 Tax=Romanomermis culicivorax TaxID=13658 RepID=A0A915JZI4_ROMCU
MNRQFAESSMGLKIKKILLYNLQRYMLWIDIKLPHNPLLGAFFYCLPRLFELNVIRCVELTTMERVPKRTVAPLRNSFEYWLLYRVIGGLLLYSLVPFLVIVVLTVKISYEIRKLPQWETRPPSMIEATRGDMTTAVGEKKPLNGSLENSRCSRTSVALAIGRSSSAASAFPERRLNQWMYVAMISKFLLCYSIPVVLDTWEMVDPDVNRSKSWAKAFFMMSGVSSFLVALNSSLNFFIYYSTSDRFRADSVRAVKFCTSSMSCSK